MKWLDKFDLFLFDFDGLLVNTEHIHHQAYVNTLLHRGFNLDWSFLEFCQKAHFESTGLRDAIYAKFPDLEAQEPSWSVIYEEKKKEYLKLLTSGRVELMPGVKELLSRLKDLNKTTCVVTNSLKEQTDLIQGQLPILKTICHWVTRQDYQNPKPSPECYLRAIELYGRSAKKIIGFEDTVKGLNALLKTPAIPVLICPANHPQIQAMTDQSITHVESFLDISSKMF